MAQLHLTEAELARDLHAVLERVRRGEEVVVEEGYRRVAVIKPVRGTGSPIDQCIAIARDRVSLATLDDAFAGDLEEIISERSPLDPVEWE